MAKQVIEVNGQVLETLPGGKFRVQLEGQEHSIIAVLSGRVRMNRIKIVPGDQVKVEMSPYDLNQGRISFRYSGSQSHTTAPQLEEEDLDNNLENES